MTAQSINPSVVERELKVLVRDTAFRKKVSALVNREAKEVTVVSPYALSEEELSNLRTQLGIASSDVTIKNEIDPSLIMGLVVKSTSYYVDYSLKGRIDGILESLK